MAEEKPNPEKISPQFLERLERELDEQVAQNEWLLEMFGAHNMRCAWKVTDCRTLLEAVKNAQTTP